MIDLRPNIIHELRRFYKLYDPFQDDCRISDEEVDRYHQRLLDCDAIRTVFDSLGRLLGYVEYWLVNYEQFGRIICRAPFNIHEENITDGNICYIANNTVDPAFRTGEVENALKALLFQKTFKVDYFTGHRPEKRHKPVLIFNRNDYINKFLKEASNGKR